MSDSIEFKLDNGVTAVYEYIPSTKIVSVQAWIKTGSVNEDEALNGISHFLEHILFKGTKNFKPDEIDFVVESAGGVMNASTSKDFTSYYITLPSEQAETAFKIIADMIFFASFIPSEIEKEKPVVLQEIERKFDNPTYEMYVDAIEVLAADTPYKREVIGTAENVKSFTPELLRKYYEGYYHPQNTTLVVVGDIPLENARTLAKRYFNIKSSAEPAELYEGEWKPTLKANAVKLYKRDVAQDYILVGYQIPAAAKDAPVYELITEILSGGEYSLLNTDLRDKGAATAAYAFELLNKRAGAYIIDLATNPKESAKTLIALDKTIRKLTEAKITQRELDGAKNRLKSSIIFRKERSSRLASEIGYSYTLELGDYHKEYLSLIDKVTLKDITDASKVIFSSPRIIYKTVPK
ncbi:MAG: insulinase family protein [Deferribacteraceae bacterium]|nr:insulinase family protein [Deferribacteraceae bacterium]